MTPQTPAGDPSEGRAALLELPDPEGAGGHRALMMGLRAFASADDRRSTWQVASTLLLVAGAFAGIALMRPYAAKWLFFLPLVGLLVRLFVLQHDCGHLSLFTNKRVCDRVGILLSLVTGVAYEAWRTEHNWHHSHQAKLSHRGIDRMNSPMTRAEAEASPENARLRARKISVRYVFVMGAASLGLQRKHHSAFFPFRPRFRWPVPNREALVRSVRMTNLGHLALHVGLVAYMGLGTWASLILPAYFCGAGVGALLFWVQHNFERTYHAEEGAWSFVEAGLHGASYLRLTGLWEWVTASIGIHHVHHLNVLIPNYRLEAARRAVPEIAAIAPLNAADLRKCFTHVFWDAEQRRMVDLGTLALSQDPVA